jgi:hypothetical protein
MEVSAVKAVSPRGKDESVNPGLSSAAAGQTADSAAFSADRDNISKPVTASPEPFLSINPRASFREITNVTRRPDNTRMLAAAAPESEKDKENRLSLKNWQSIFKELPVTDRGIDDESDEYAFSSYPKSSKKYQLGFIKAKMESFQNITGIDQGTFRILSGNTTGDKKFNFDGAAIGLELNVRQNAYAVNTNPQVLLPVDNNSNYFFEKRNLDFAENNGNLTGVFSLEGVKLGIRYEKGQGLSISNVEFHEGALTTNLIDFAKNYPYIVIPVATAVTSGLVAGSYFLTKKTGPLNLNMGNITVYRLDSDDHDLRVGISPGLSIDGSEKFTSAFKLPGGAASVLYKFHEDFTLSLNGGYNIVDGPHFFAGSALRF